MQILIYKIKKETLPYEFCLRLLYSKKKKTFFVFLLMKKLFFKILFTRFLEKKNVA